MTMHHIQMSTMTVFRDYFVSTFEKPFSKLLAGKTFTGTLQIDLR